MIIMRTGRIILVASLLGAASIPMPAAAGDPVPLTLDTAVRAAIERNLDVRVETFNPAIAETDVRRARGIYNPRVSGLLDYGRTNEPLDPLSSLADRKRFFDGNLSASQLLPTGATAIAAFTNSGPTLAYA